MMERSNRELELVRQLLVIISKHDSLEEEKYDIPAQRHPCQLLHNSESEPEVY
jgi:hypothetical protein